MTTLKNPFAAQREKANKTQRQIAAQVDKTPQAVSAWETGKAIPGPADYDLVAEAYGVTREWVVEAVMQLDNVPTS